jgi:hypothetical protein
MERGVWGERLNKAFHFKYIYIRRDSSNQEASQEEKTALYEWLKILDQMSKSRINNRNSLSWFIDKNMWFGTWEDEATNIANKKAKQIGLSDEELILMIKQRENIQGFGSFVLAIIGILLFIVFLILIIPGAIDITRNYNEIVNLITTKDYKKAREKIQTNELYNHQKEQLQELLKNSELQVFLEKNDLEKATNVLIGYIMSNKYKERLLSYEKNDVNEQNRIKNINEAYIKKLFGIMN